MALRGDKHAVRDGRNENMLMFEERVFLLCNTLHIHCNNPRITLLTQTQTQKSPSYNDTALIAAVDGEHLDVATELLESGFCDPSLKSLENGSALSCVNYRIRQLRKNESIVLKMFEEGSKTTLFRFEEFHAKLTVALAAWPTAPYASATIGARCRVRFRNKPTCTPAELRTKMEEVAEQYRASAPERKKKFEDEQEEKKRKEREAEEEKKRKEKEAEEEKKRKEKEKQEAARKAAEERKIREAELRKYEEERRKKGAETTKEEAQKLAAKREKNRRKNERRKQKKTEAKNQVNTQVIKSNDKKPATQSVTPSVDLKCACGNSVSKKCEKALCGKCCGGPCKFHKK
jgi:hypothetical protein